MPGDGWLKLDFSSSKLDAFREQIATKMLRLQDVLYARVSMLANQLSVKVIGKLTNDVLHVRTGILRGSVHADTTTDGTTIRGTVTSSQGSAFYGRFHEFGVPRVWEVLATKNKMLRIQLGVKENAREIFRKSVLHPPLPERSFMRSSLDESREEIIRELGRGVADVLKEK